MMNALVLTGLFFALAFPVNGRSRTIAPGDSISKAIRRCSPGDTLILKPGLYKEWRIVVDRALTIAGETGTVVDAEGSGEVFTITSSDVTVRNLTIRNAGVSFTRENAGIRLNNVRNITIENNRFENNFFSIYVSKSSDCRVAKNILRSSGRFESSSGNGVHVWSSERILIEDNTIEGHRDGIYFEFVRSSVIRNNHSRHNLRYGLHFMFSDSCVYTANRFEKNLAGVAVMYTRNILMDGNRFLDNWGAASYGLLLKDISDSRITNNDFVNNTTGVYMEGSSRNRIAGNVFDHNGWALKVLGNANDNRFETNDFVGNTLDVSTNSRTSTNRFTHNYWSRYEGYDLDRDGAGDVPYHPVSLFSYMTERHPEALFLLHSFVVDLLDAAERIFPSLTPPALTDETPDLEKHRDPHPPTL